MKMRTIIKAVVISLITMFIAICITMVVSRCISSSPFAAGITMPVRIIVLYLMVFLFYTRSLKRVPLFLGFKKRFLAPFIFGIVLSLPIGLIIILFLFINKIPLTFSVGSLSVSFLLIFLGPGLFEEGLFRGLLFKQLSKEMSWWKAALFTGILFGLVHLLRVVTGSPIIRAVSQTFIAFSVSFLFGYIFWKMKWNIWTCVSLHTFIDCYPACLIAREHLQQNMSMFYMYSIAGFVVLFLFVFLLVRKEKIFKFLIAE